MTPGKKYWFTDAQVREIAKVKIELNHFKIENMNLYEMKRLCDSSTVASRNSYNILNNKYDLKNQQLDNAYLIIEQERGKFEIADETLKSMTLRKNVYVITTIVASVAVLVLIIKP